MDGSDKRSSDTTHVYSPFEGLSFDMKPEAICIKRDNCNHSPIQDNQSTTLLLCGVPQLRDVTLEAHSRDTS